MSDQINRTTMQVHKSVNSPDFPDHTFLKINGLIFPECDKRYWKIVGEQIVEMTIEEKDIVDYIEPQPEPIPPTVEEIEIKRKLNIANDIAKTYSISEEISILRKLQIGELLVSDIEVQDWINTANISKAKYPKV